MSNQKKKRASLIMVACIFSLANLVFAQDAPNSGTIEIFTAFRKYKKIDNIGYKACLLEYPITESSCKILKINVPTVVEVPIENDFLERLDFAVFNETENKFEPSYLKNDILIQKIPVTAESSLDISSANLMVDNNVNTFSEFMLPENAVGTVSIALKSSEPITSSALTVLLDNNVALPTSIEIRANVGVFDKIIVAKRSMSRQSIQFPKTTSNSWRINLTYSQPLRISELRLEEENVSKTISRGLRFLASPNTTYRIYFDSDRRVYHVTGEAGNLSNNEGVLKLATLPTMSNPTYTLSDTDKDNISDIYDNCVSLSNFDQVDIDRNGRGDACDDFDRDGIINIKDNCKDLPNSDQADVDGDKIGNVCDKEESRITEQYPWLPWLGIGFAAIVLIALFVITAKSTK